MRIMFDGCQICLGITKTKCIMCGHKRPQKQHMTEREQVEVEGIENHLKYLRDTYYKMKNLKMETSGCPSTDAQVRKYIGEWRR